MLAPVLNTTTSRFRLVVVAFIALLATACEGAIDVGIDVNEDGSGEVGVVVSMDDEAADALLDLDSERGLPLEDLTRAGWRISSPERADDGLTRIGVTKSFGTPEQFAEVMDEIAGEAGLFADFELLRTKSFATVQYEVVGTVAPGGLDPFADSAFTGALGQSVTALAQRLGGTASDVDVRVRVNLPGSVDDGVASTGQLSPAVESGVEQLWQTELSAGQPTEVRFGSRSRGVAALVWRGLAVVALVVAALVAFGHVLRLLRPERRGRKAKAAASKRPRVSAKTGEKPVEPEAQPVVVAGEGTGDDKPRVVALDGMGVLYREGSDISEILIPFAREMGSEMTNDEIAARARALSLGRLMPVDFWRSIGVEGDANELDDQYLSRHQLSPGVVKFLRDLRDRGVRVACLTDDCTMWAAKLRSRHSLEGLIDPWVVSGTVGARKPDASVFEVLRRVTGEPPSAILVVDDKLDNLDAARDLGFQTAWFAPQGDAAGARSHAILRSFAVSDGSISDTAASDA